MVTRFVRFEPGGGGVVRNADNATKPDLQHFREVLLEQRRFRLEQLAQLAADEQNSAELIQVTAALRHAAATALGEVEAALHRISAGTYGRCVQCEHEILPERLEIVPMAALCMTCQRLAEADSD